MKQASKKEEQAGERKKERKKKKSRSQEGRKMFITAKGADTPPVSSGAQCGCSCSCHPPLEPYWVGPESQTNAQATSG